MRLLLLTAFMFGCILIFVGLSIIRIPKGRATKAAQILCSIGGAIAVISYLAMLLT